MTPGIKVAKKAKVNFHIHEYSHDPSSESYGLEAVEKLGLPQQRVFKTLVVSVDGKELLVTVLPVAKMLNLKAVAKLVGAKKATMADKQLAQRSTGYVLGGVSPLGQKKRLKTLIDESAADLDTMFVSAGRRGLEIELSPNDLIKLTDGKLVSIAVD